MQNYYVISTTKKMDLFDVFEVINKTFIKYIYVSEDPDWNENLVTQLTQLDCLKKALKYAYRVGYKSNKKEDMTRDIIKMKDCLIRCGVKEAKENYKENWKQFSELYEINQAMQQTHPNNAELINKVWYHIFAILKTNCVAHMLDNVQVGLDR